MSVGSATGAPTLAIAGLRSEQQQQMVTAQGVAANLQAAGETARGAGQQGAQPAAPAESGRGTTLDISV
ncbi:hypothetical protein [Oceanibaculum nanhaiense]|uniref:hypothetical protein n=1 Tax=Oceanibaculum nanhaiense TaxID=1909734 RepID=UPI00396F25E4